MTHDTSLADTIKWAAHHQSDRLRRRYFDTKLNATMVLVTQGDYYVSSDPGEILTTILGSCIAVCARDPELGFGGMNHFVLPDVTAASECGPSLELRYGSYSIERLVNAIINRGGQRKRLEIKVFGGANVTGASNIGHHNSDFVEEYMRREQLPIAAKMLRCRAPCKVRYFPATGKVQLREMQSLTTAAKFDVAARLKSRQQLDENTGRVVLFDNTRKPA